jgi:pimeloyl-ACP methyl ester carboxylesterase
MLVDGGITQLAETPGATWERTRERLAPPRLGGTPQEDFLARLAEWTHPWGSDERVPQIILANFELAEDETIWPRLTYERHMQIVRAMWEFETYERLARLRCPAAAVLAIPPEPHFPGETGSLELKQRGAERARQALPGLQIHWLADTVHDIPLHRPVELAQLIGEFSASL